MFDARAPKEEDLIGQQVQGYRIDKVLGSGASGTVYLGIKSDGEPAAIKVLHGRVAANPTSRRRFEREALAMVLAAHPNCVSVLDATGLPDGRLCLLLEYVEGVMLEELLDQEEVLDVRRTLRIAGDVLTGLAHAHDAGVVHRDIKPANVIITSPGTDRELARIVDFGVAKLTGKAGAGLQQLTRAGIAVGTPHYMAPELMKHQEIDGRADLYSLAAAMFEMLCGRPPFIGDDPVEILRGHAVEPAPRFRDIDDSLDIPEKIEHVIRRGLEKQPEQRYANARKFAAALRATGFLPEETRETMFEATLLMAETPLRNPAPATKREPAAPKPQAKGLPAPVSGSLPIPMQVPPAAAPTTPPAASPTTPVPARSAIASPTVYSGAWTHLREALAQLRATPYWIPSVVAAIALFIAIIASFFVD